MKLPVIPAEVATADNTTLSWHDRCPRLYEYSAIRGLRSRGSASAALQFGSILHEGLEAWYRTHDLEQALIAIRDYERFEEIPGEYRTRGRALVTIAEYIEWWGDNSLWWGDNVIFTETPFTLEDDDGFRYGGKIDLIVEYHGKPWLVDHKSTSRGGSSWWSQFKIAPQLMGYVWAGSLLHGEPLAGVIINRLLIHKNKKPPHEQFDRKAFYISPSQVEEWRRGKIEQYHIIKQQKENGFFPMRSRNCMEKYGLCQFHEVCTTKNVEARERILESQFEVDPWDWMTLE